MSETGRRQVRASTNRCCPSFLPKGRVTCPSAACLLTLPLAARAVTQQLHSAVCGDREIRGQDSQKPPNSVCSHVMTFRLVTSTLSIVSESRSTHKVTQSASVIGASRPGTEICVDVGMEKNVSLLEYVQKAKTYRSRARITLARTQSTLNTTLTNSGC